MTRTNSIINLKEIFTGYMTAEVSFFVAKNRKENSHEKRKRPTMNRLFKAV